MKDDSQTPNPPRSSFEIPDLELEPRQASPKRLSSSRGAGPGGGGWSFEPDALGDTDSPPLELDLDSERPLPRSPGAPPSERALDPVGRQIEPAALERLASFGPIPSTVGSTPAYAYRVFARQRELKRKLAELTEASARQSGAQAEASSELEEQLRRAIGSYDATRVAQGVRLACTLAALLLLLIAMYFAF